MAVLVTGGAGFIGSHVVDNLLMQGYEVVVLDNLSGGYRDNVNPQADFFDGSIVDPDVVEGIFERVSIDYVIHTAAYAAEGLSHFVRRYNYTNNLLGSANLINSAIRHKVKRFVFTSSMSVYGENTPPFTEDMKPAPEDPYAIAKTAVETDLRVAHALHGLDYTIIRPHNVYGERQNLADPYRNVIAIFMRQMLLGLSVSVFGDGEQVRAFSHISDTAPLIVKAMTADLARNQIFNVGGDTPVTINEMVLALESALGISAQVVHHPTRYEVKYAFSSHDKANALLGRGEPLSFNVGLKRMADWAKTFDFSKTTKLPPIELWDKLPEKWLKINRGE